MKATELLSTNETIILNGGTTTWNLASHLPKNGLTNSLPVVDYVSRQCLKNSYHSVLPLTLEPQVVV